MSTSGNRSLAAASAASCPGLGNPLPGGIWDHTTTPARNESQGTRGVSIPSFTSAKLDPTSRANPFVRSSSREQSVIPARA